jgi:hypothetical protein
MKQVAVAVVQVLLRQTRMVVLVYSGLTVLITAAVAVVAVGRLLHMKMVQVALAVVVMAVVLGLLGINKHALVLQAQQIQAVAAAVVTKIAVALVVPVS